VAIRRACSAFSAESRRCGSKASARRTASDEESGIKAEMGLCASFDTFCPFLWVILITDRAVSPVSRDDLGSYGCATAGTGQLTEHQWGVDIVVRI
jgi:hypothetical protein